MIHRLVKALIVLSEGNPGALTVLAEVIKKDPMNLEKNPT